MIKYIQDSGIIHKENTVKGAKKMDLSVELKKVVDRLKVRVEREIPDKGYFRNFAENFDKDVNPDFYAKNVALFIERDEAREGRAYLGVSVLHPKLSMDSATYLMNGDRNKILEYINNKEFAKELEETVLELSESLKKQG